LQLFRVPPLIPDIQQVESQIKSRVAEAMAAAVHDSASVGVTRVPGHPHQRSELNTVVVDFLADGPGKFTRSRGPQFVGAKGFGEAMRGQKIRDLPDLPIDVSLKASREKVVASLASDPAIKAIPEPPEAYGTQYTDAGGWKDLTRPKPHSRTLDEIYGAFPGSAPAEVKRYTDGLVAVEGGDLGERLYLYELTNPGSDLGQFIASFLKGIGEPTSPEKTANTIAEELAAFLSPTVVMEGGTHFIRSYVEPLGI
jgi:hypothetical protein